MAQRTEQRRRLVWGAVCTTVVSAAALAVWGRGAVPAAATFGAMATAVQLVAAQLMARTGKPAALDHLTVYVIGVFFCGWSAWCCWAWRCRWIAQHFRRGRAHWDTWERFCRCSIWRRNWDDDAASAGPGAGIRHRRDDLPSHRETRTNSTSSRSARSSCRGSRRFTSGRCRSTSRPPSTWCSCCWRP